MPSTFSANLRLELPGTGEQQGQWGNTTNTNLGVLVESAIAGATPVVTNTASYALTVADGAADQARYAILRISTTSGAAFAVYAPPVPKWYIVQNAAGGHVCTLYNSTAPGNTTAAGTGVEIPPGRTFMVMSEGTNFSLVGEVATEVNTANTVVRRNASGNFAAGTITANLTGNVTGDVIGNVTGDVTGNVTGDVTGTAANVTGLVAIDHGGTGAATVNDAKLGLQTGRLAPNDQAANYTITTTDVGGVVILTGGDVTIPPGVFAPGDVVVLVNNHTSTARTILRGAGVTLTWVGGVNANRTLGVYGVATILCLTASHFIITGQGVN
jgi:hypothetical protein